jgi:hypothetical protein
MIMKASGEVRLVQVACRILPKRTLTAFGTAMGLLILSLGADCCYAQTNVTPAQYLASQPKPNFAVSYSLPPLTRDGYVLSSNTDIELANNWGYCLELGGVSYSNIVARCTQAGTFENQMVLLASNNPTKYKLSVIMDSTFPATLSSRFWVTNSSGQFMTRNSSNVWSDMVYTNVNGNMVWTSQTHPGWIPAPSPEGPDSDWAAATVYTMNNLAGIQSNCPIAVLLDDGEWGLDCVGFGKSAWELDPRVQAQAVMTNAFTDTVGEGGYTVTNQGMSWPNYISHRKAHQLGFLTAAINQQLTNRILSIFYSTGNEQTRCYVPDPWGQVCWENWQDGWGFWSEVMNTNTDLPCFQSYFYRYQGWTNPPGAIWSTPNMDLLTEQLNGVGYDINLGYPLNYSFVCSGFDSGSGNTNQLSDISLYTGFLKCLYTAGMVGANAGYYSYPSGTNGTLIGGPGFDAAFPSNSPPHWLMQMMVLSHVHALFSHLENFLYNGDLLTGPQPHLMSADQPAYEFTNTAGYANDRVLARKLRGQNQWIVTAWAADGITNNVTVTIPTIGNLTVTAVPAASVYQVTMTGTNVTQTLLDEYASFPPPIILTGEAKLLNGAFQFAFTNTPGGTNTVLTTTNLLLPLTNWTVLGTVTDSPPGQFQFTDPQAINHPLRFYRVRLP